jgi:2C-methyl-D-erythritol 2,4-cyclodiphosphate synthase
MIANMARLLGLERAQVNIKGKTHEKVDAVGEGRAVEVHVVALLAGSA